MQINGEMRSGEMPQEYSLLFERIVTVDGKLAKQQFWGDTTEGCNNTFAMKYELIENKATGLQLLEKLEQEMEQAKSSLVDREEYEEAGAIKQLLEVLKQLRELK